MAGLKLCIADPKTGKTFKKELDENDSKHFMGLNIGEPVKGEVMGMTGFEFEITGGSDYCGFPMRRGILGVRKSITIKGGVGYSGGRRGQHKRRTVCGHKVNDKISQVNLKVTKASGKGLAAALGGEGEEGKDAAPEQKEAPKAEDKPAAEEKKDAAPKEEKPAAKKEEPKAESKEAKKE